MKRYLVLVEKMNLGLGNKETILKQTTAKKKILGYYVFPIGISIT